MGIDENNNVITKESKLYSVYQQLRKLCNDNSEHHAWSDKYLDKEKFLIYQVAKIFKNDNNLFQETKKVIDFSILKRWNSYQTLKKLITEKKLYRAPDGKTVYSRTQAAPYFLGEEQALAYMVCYTIRTLWYGALRISAFQQETGGIIQSFGEYVSKAKNFLQVWNKIVSKLPKRKNYFSFEGHGWVISFDKNIIKHQTSKIDDDDTKKFLQDLSEITEDEEDQAELENLLNSKEKIKDLTKKRINIIDSIKCVGIESMFSKELPSFYKKARQEDKWNKHHIDRKKLACLEELLKQIRGIVFMKNRPKDIIPPSDFIKVNFILNRLQEENKKGNLFGKSYKNNEIYESKTLNEILGNELTQKQKGTLKFDAIKDKPFTHWIFDLSMKFALQKESFNKVLDEQAKKIQKTWGQKTEKIRHKKKLKLNKKPHSKLQKALATLRKKLIDLAQSLSEKIKVEETKFVANKVMKSTSKSKTRSPIKPTFNKNLLDLNGVLEIGENWIEINLDSEVTNVRLNSINGLKQALLSRNDLSRFVDTKDDGSKDVFARIHLNLSNNSISDISQLSSLIGLATLNLENNKINDNSLKNILSFDNLQTISFRKNLISNIKQALKLKANQKTKRLKIIDLRDNKISSVPDLSKYNDSDLELYLEGNPLNKDSKIETLSKKYKTIDFKWPDHYRDKDVL